ncbi:recombinase RecT [Mycobacteroides abscessus]|nr:recombinase RecT [Mycobacteroides abscessus]MDM2451192.1 recombinase RecT [Mycobacteroides abscessus]MDM2455662.1 recombinase RecT [Mycobacteroides abscessus]MDM2460414.1 recombinase RecT [Mycobacteroides abscessus]MDM2466154.1 recombinase RecT [Mycobacteroides abscessus]
MPETTEAERTGINLGADPNRARPPATAASSALALRAGQGDWTEDQRTQLRSMGLEHATEADLRLLYHYAARTGLDPFTKQVYLVSRKTKVKVRVTNPQTGNDRIEEREVDKFTAQVGIDGWRVIGTRAARRDGVRVSHEDVLYRGKGTGWQDYWDNDDGTPVSCKYALTVDGVRISATVAYSEYVQLVQRDGQWQPNAMWKKMPGNQLAKCGEALAWRKAFPADYSGIVFEDAAQPHEIIDGEVIEAGAPVATDKAAPRKASGAARNRQRAARAAQSAPEPEQSEPPAMSEQKRRQFLDSMFGFLDQGQITQRDDQLRVIAQLGGLDVLPDHRDELDDATLHRIVTKLAHFAKTAHETDNPSKAMSEALTDVLASWASSSGAGQ